MTKEEIVQAISEDKMMPFIQPEQLANIVDFVIKNSKPSLPSNMDEAAEEYEENKVHSISALGTDKDGFAYYMRTGTSFSDAFKAGAEWMAGQGWLLDGEVKDQPTGGDDFEIYLDYDRNKMEDILDEICDYVNANYPDDDNRYKVVVQIRKK